MSNKKIKESKEKIYSLAKVASNKINENKYITQQITLYENEIKTIKEFLIKCSSLEGDENNKKKIIYDNINNNYNMLKSIYLKLKEDKNKISQKCSAYEDAIFNENTTLRQDLKIKNIDNFILISQLKERDFQILKLKNKIKDFQNLFSLEKKEIKASNNVGCYYLDNDLESSSKKLNKELLYFNLYNRECRVSMAKLKTLSKKNEYYEEIINYFEKNLGNRNTQKFKEDDGIINIIMQNNNELINTKRNKKKIKSPKKLKKINILTVSELFDINNDEGKSEEIIDDELHSDDEVIFEPKIKQHKKVSKGENLQKIKSLVPNVDLSQINFNKQKVMNEADLYSFQNRKFQAQNIDEQIKEMASKKKQILHKFRTNQKKLIAIRNFAKETKNKYKLLKQIKLKTSVFDGFLGNNNITQDIEKEMNDELNEIKEEENENENEENDENDYNLVQDNNSIDENINYTQRSIFDKEKRKLKKMKSINLDKSIKKDKKKKQKQSKTTKKKIKRAKSK